MWASKYLLIGRDHKILNIKKISVAHHSLCVAVFVGASKNSFSDTQIFKANFQAVCTDALLSTWSHAPFLAGTVNLSNHLLRQAIARCCAEKKRTWVPEHSVQIFVYLFAPQCLFRGSVLKRHFKLKWAIKLRYCIYIC